MIKWVDKFLEIAKSNSLNCHILHRERGWIETIIINNQRCFCKSKTYDDKKREYYIGVDPKGTNGDRRKMIDKREASQYDILSRSRI